MAGSIVAMTVAYDAQRRYWSWYLDYAPGGGTLALAGHGFDSADVALADLTATVEDQRRQGVRTAGEGAVESLATPTAP